MIAWLRALLVSLFAMLLLGQSAAAASHCLWQARHVAAANGLAVPICTPEGLRQAHSAPGWPDDPPPVHAEPCLCMVCHALPQAQLPQPPILPAPAWQLLARVTPLPPALPPRPATRAPPGLPRGPPSA
ncbi:hypothetical protein QMO56_00070 [Roseomonas sp. E05]|uniref:DUF2946 family protein n=1 Tax=Roseomonas sp. E05 TaxID=3046310 RepID=UPI0024BA10D5|nr:DUF2946 family protein [Roseomonas sp. E05]MDJ0386491.1 hypothetical protein [Roseomonas sp. E05]